MILGGGKGDLILFLFFVIFTYSQLFLFVLSEVPVIRFDDISSSCSTQEDNGEVYLVLGPVEGLGDGDEVLDYVWKQVRGEEVRCSERFFFFFNY